MIDSMLCQVYKLNHDYVFKQKKYRDGTIFKEYIERDRIILQATYVNHRGYPKISTWILATKTKPAEKIYHQKFEQIRVLDLSCLEKINLEDEQYRWINNHLNKQVRFYLRHSKYLTSRVLIEKYKKPAPVADNYLDELLRWAPRHYHIETPSLMDIIKNFVRNIFS